MSKVRFVETEYSQYVITDEVAGGLLYISEDLHADELFNVIDFFKKEEVVGLCPKSIISLFESEFKEKYPDLEIKIFLNSSIIMIDKEKKKEKDNE